MHTPDGFAPSHTLPAVLPGTALAFAFSDANLLVGGSDAAPTVPTLDQLGAAGVDGIRHYLGELAGVPCVAIGLANPISTPSDFQLLGLRALFFRVPETLLAIGARAFQIVEWDRTHRFCGRCGAPTRDKTSERAKECPVCRYVAYPRVSPAMMALVTRGRELLLARAHRFPPGRYSALAGFVEPGETIEDCIRREVKEEVGIDVDGITYFASQSWAFPHSLMIAFPAENAAGDLHPDAPEFAAARGFAPDPPPDIPRPLSSPGRRLTRIGRGFRGGEGT